MQNEKPQRWLNADSSASATNTLCANSGITTATIGSSNTFVIDLIPLQFAGG
jgi:hypothetical protein